MTREEAISRIENHIRVHSKQEPFRACHIQEALKMAIDALKAQEPRVLTYDEARNNAMEFMNPDSIKPLFIEFRTKDDDDEEGLRPPWRGGYNQRMMLLHSKDRYGVEFRFWTDRPSAEQMEAVPWEAKAENAGS